VLLEALLVANLDRIAKAFDGDQRSDCTSAPSRPTSSSFLHVAVRTRSKWLIESTLTALVDPHPLSGTTFH
jgi:hypothetical protein